MRVWVWLMLWVSPCLLAEQLTDAHAPEEPTVQVLQPVVVAKRQMVVSAHPLATHAGWDMLRRGGSAVDALVAAQLVLTLVEPQSSGLGGGAFALYWDGSKQALTSFDGRETAPQAATPNLFLDESGEPLAFYDAVVGPRSVATPGTLKLLEELHHRYGKLPWATLFEPALHWSKNGFLVTPRLAQLIEQDAEKLARFPETAAYFLPGGQPLRAGHLLRNPLLRNTLTLLADEGSSPLYRGALGRYLVERVASVGGESSGLALTDLEAYEVIERAPVCAPYHDYRVCGMGPPSSGAITLGQILGILSHYELRSLGPNNPNSWRLIGDASRLAFADRAHYLADTDFIELPHNLLDSEYLKKRASLLNRADALPSVEVGKPRGVRRVGPADSSLELPSTTQISIRDRWGNLVSVTSTIENGFGSRLMVGGFLLNNELTDFSFRPEVNGVPVANRVEPGKRPRSSMAPTIVFKGEQPYLVLGSPGGSRIIGYMAKTLVAHLDWDLSLQDAIELPHALNRFGTYELEQGTAAETLIEPLQALGFSVKLEALNSGIHAIAIEEDRLIGVADSRREGNALGD